MLGSHKFEIILRRFFPSLRTPEVMFSVSYYVSSLSTKNTKYHQKYQIPPKIPNSTKIPKISLILITYFSGKPKAVKRKLKSKYVKEKIEPKYFVFFHPK
jgi:hypothetical protein